jgi:enterochelin esterase-like enzyme
MHTYTHGIEVFGSSFGSRYTMSNTLPATSSVPICGRIEKQKLISTITGIERRMQIYLPPSYDTQLERHYPVLYVHFGQHIFDPHRPGDEAWYLHHLLESLLAANRIEEIIVVGIAAERATVGKDYGHYAPTHRGAEIGGFVFETYIVEELKPFVDSQYRTLRTSEHTAMVGASRSTVVTYNIAQRHPDIFGKIGLLSPLVYNSHEGVWLYSTPFAKFDGLLWVGISDAEGHYTLTARDFLAALLAQGFTPEVDLFYTILPNGGHDDATWGVQMIHPLLLFFGTGGTTPAERIGRAVAVELLGDDNVGVASQALHVNPLVHYDSGFCTTALSGEYRVASPDLLSVQSYNRLCGLMEGESDVTFTFNGLRTTRRYRVVPGLSDVVHLHLRAYTPPESPDFPQIWFSRYPLTRTSRSCYEGFYTFPRGFALRAVFSWDMRKFERCADGSPRPYRLLRATEDATIDCTIERWGGLDT